MKLEPVIIIFLWIIPVLIFSQHQNNIWYFGYHSGLDFNTNPPTVIRGEMTAIEGCASVTDPSGHLLFYSNGISVWDRNHNIMPNGNGLSGGASSTQAAVIVPYPGSNSKYYLFSTEDQTTDGGLSYSIIDMVLNAGFGDIVPGTKNTLVVDQTSEKVTAVLHANGGDIWIVTHLLNSDEFLSYLLTPAGINMVPVISSIGSFYNADAFIGPVKSSHDGSKLVCMATEYDIADMFDFNTTTGEITNPHDINEMLNGQSTEPLNMYGIEFSPNDSLLYLSGVDHEILHNYLIQIDLNSHEVTTLNDTHPGLVYFGSLQLAPDDQIYMALFNGRYLDVIHKPNKIGTACQYEENGIYLKFDPLRTFSLDGLPGLVPYSFFRDTNAVHSFGNDTTLCLGNSLTLIPDFPTNCDNTTYFWNDGSSGSELVVNQTGEYRVEINSSCGSFRDTIKVDFISCQPIVNYDLNACESVMANGSHMDYSEFVPSYPSQLTCADVSAHYLFRSPPQENKHSCTPGINNSPAMCVTTLNACEYIPGNASSVVIEFTINPTVDSIVKFTGLEFYEKGPLTFDWINGPSGPNNYPLYYGIRVLKNGIEIFRKKEIHTTPSWALQHFDFLNDSLFIVEGSTDFRIELLPYCPGGISADVSAWDIDEISIFGGCIPFPNNMSSIKGKVLTKDGHPISGVEMQLSGNSSFAGYEKKVTDASGVYSFDQLQIGHSYFIKGYKNDDMSNGVSTLDMIQIQKHLLGVTPFTSLHQYIASDINHNGNIAVMDLLDIRKLLLGLNSSFPHNTSWRFGSQPQDLTGNDISTFKEVGYVEHLGQDAPIMDFVGIKIGDLNGDVHLKSKPSSEPENREH